mmetsp:Transcript_55980/g.149291  ORF Transcript_55980/g.149291 Transcript_55980/m.149291 type:complete len:465 (-) Transcript_55980:916-2310(-)
MDMSWPTDVSAPEMPPNLLLSSIAADMLMLFWASMGHSPNRTDTSVASDWPRDSGLARARLDPGSLAPTLGWMGRRSAIARRWLISGRCNGGFAGWVFRGALGPRAIAARSTGCLGLLNLPSWSTSFLSMYSADCSSAVVSKGSNTRLASEPQNGMISIGGNITWYSSSGPRGGTRRTSYKPDRRGMSSSPRPMPSSPAPASSPLVIAMSSFSSASPASGSSLAFGSSVRKTGFALFSTSSFAPSRGATSLSISCWVRSCSSAPNIALPPRQCRMLRRRNRHRRSTGGVSRNFSSTRSLQCTSSGSPNVAETICSALGENFRKRHSSVNAASCRIVLVVSSRLASSSSDNPFLTISLQNSAERRHRKRRRPQCRMAPFSLTNSSRNAAFFSRAVPSIPFLFSIFIICSTTSLGISSTSCSASCASTSRRIMIESCSVSVISCRRARSYKSASQLYRWARRVSKQ